SVRSAREAVAAPDGGSGLIDVKEPAAGSLGRVADEVIAAVIRAVAGRRPVSAGRGELAEAPRVFPADGRRYHKGQCGGSSAANAKCKESGDQPSSCQRNTELWLPAARSVPSGA